MPKETNKLKSMEGIRGVAAFIVVLSHLQLTFFLGIDNRINKSFDFFPQPISTLIVNIFKALHDGNFSVWLFWVMSGFVLSLKYFISQKINSSNSQNILLSSSIKRYFRLAIPVLISVVIAYTLLSNNLMTNKLLSMALGEAYSKGWLGGLYSFDASIYNAIKSALWNTFFNYNQYTTYNAVLWTMEAELWGSLFVFSYLALTGKHKLRYSLYFVVTIIAYGRSSHWLNAFVFGTLLSDLYVNNAIMVTLREWNKSTILTSIIVLVFLFFIGMSNHSEIGKLILATLFVFFVLTSDMMIAAFSSRIPVLFGRISFPLYLIHLPIICSVSGYIYLELHPAFGHMFSAVVSSLITITVSIFSAIILSKVADDIGVTTGRHISRALLKWH